MLMLSLDKGLFLLYTLLISKNVIDRLHVVNAPGIFSESDDNNLSWGSIQILRYDDPWTHEPHYMIDKSGTITIISLPDHLPVCRKVNTDVRGISSLGDLVQLRSLRLRGR